MMRQPVVIFSFTDSLMLNILSHVSFKVGTVKFNSKEPVWSFECQSFKENLQLVSH